MSSARPRRAEDNTCVRVRHIALSFKRSSIFTPALRLKSKSCTEDATEDAAASKRFKSNSFSWLRKDDSKTIINSMQHISKLMMIVDTGCGSSLKCRDSMRSSDDMFPQKKNRQLLEFRSAYPKNRTGGGGVCSILAYFCLFFSQIVRGSVRLLNKKAKSLTDPLEKFRQK